MPWGIRRIYYIFIHIKDVNMLYIFTSPDVKGVTLSARRFVGPNQRPGQRTIFIWTNTTDARETGHFIPPTDSRPQHGDGLGIPVTKVNPLFESPRRSTNLWRDKTEIKFHDSMNVMLNREQGDVWERVPLN